MDAFLGSDRGKNVSRRFTHAAMHALSPHHYHNSNHLYLAGPDAGDVKEAWNHPGIYSINKIYAAEKSRDRCEMAKNQLGLYLSNCVRLGDVRDVAAHIERVGILFLDTCGTLNNNSVALVRSLLPYVEKKGVIAFNFTYTRDCLRAARYKARYNLSPAYSRHQNWKAIATALLAGAELPEIYFSAAISYANVGSDKGASMSMLTLIGRKTEKRKVCEPLYFVRFRGDIKICTSSCKDDFTLHAFKAHLPIEYKKLFI